MRPHLQWAFIWIYFQNWYNATYHTTYGFEYFQYLNEQQLQGFECFLVQEELAKTGENHFYGNRFTNKFPWSSLLKTARANLYIFAMTKIWQHIWQHISWFWKRDMFFTSRENTNFVEINWRDMVVQTSNNNLNFL